MSSIGAKANRLIAGMLLRNGSTCAPAGQDLVGGDVVADLEQHRPDDCLGERLEVGQRGDVRALHELDAHGRRRGGATSIAVLTTSRSAGSVARVRHAERRADR